MNKKNTPAHVNASQLRQILDAQEVSRIWSGKHFEGVYKSRMIRYEYATLVHGQGTLHVSSRGAMHNYKLPLRLTITPNIESKQISKLISKTFKHGKVTEYTTLHRDGKITYTYTHRDDQYNPAMPQQDVNYIYSDKKGLSALLSITLTHAEIVDFLDELARAAEIVESQ